MYRVHIQKEVATTLPFTKVSADNSFDSDKHDKDLYLKGSSSKQIQ